jgi:hypothetical protein
MKDNAVAWIGANCQKVNTKFIDCSLIFLEESKNEE